MSLQRDATRLARLAVVMQTRDAVVEPLLLAASVSESDTLLVGASAHGRRFDVIMNFTEEAYAAIAPDLPIVAGDHIRVRVDGATSVAAVRTGQLAPRAAVDALAPPAVRDAWFDLVEQLCSIADARIIGTTLYVDGSRAEIAIRYPARSRETEMILMEGISQLAEDIGVSDAQRRLWARVHPELGRGSEIVLTTACTQTAVSAHFAISYPITDWAVAMRLAEGLVLNDSEAKQVPKTLGQLAGALGSDRLDSVELVLGPHEPPDVIVWARVASTP